ncbi:Lipase [Zostera marina]|uniref:Lipase n=1 Tax=Zostera marina TaxID=29655 RepID=A0A0K9PJP4_ZOSMR|nr:Lipase [Zostera marina]
MELLRFLPISVVIFICLTIVSSESIEIKLGQKDNAQNYNHEFATTVVEYASAVYENDPDKLLKWNCIRCGNDKIKNFKIIQLVVDVQNCLQAFIGFADDLNSIVIAFRGTRETSIRNWVENLSWKQLDLNYPDMPDAMVHHGFYSAYHETTLRPGILDGIQKAKTSMGSNTGIIVTGHSMGGAMATFCALDLTINNGMDDVQLMTFGQPRVGNAAFASHFSQHVPNTFRVTNNNDMVPHLPPYVSELPQKTYHHVPTEVWLYKSGGSGNAIEKICDGSGEDPNCSRSVPGNSISDHLEYFGVELRADKSETSKIVANKSLGNIKIDDYGNLVLSKDLSNPPLPDTISQI